MKPPDSTLTSEVEQPIRTRKKSISLPGVVYVLIYHCYGGAKDLYPQLMKAQSEMLPLRFSWQIQISPIDIKAVMITWPRTQCQVVTLLLRLPDKAPGFMASGHGYVQPLHCNLLFISFGTHWRTHGSHSRRWYDCHELLTMKTDFVDLGYVCVLLIMQIFHLQNERGKKFSNWFVFHCVFQYFFFNLRTAWLPLSCNCVLVFWLIGLWLSRCCSTTHRFSDKNKMKRWLMLSRRKIRNGKLHYWMLNPDKRNTNLLWIWISLSNKLLLDEGFAFLKSCRF